jgi:hypothetical protein
MRSRSRVVQLAFLIGLLALPILQMAGCANDSPSSTTPSQSQTTATIESAMSTTGDAAKQFVIIVSGPAIITRPTPQTVILSAAWGAGTGQFGLNKGDSQKGPSAFAVNEGGDWRTLAVADDANSRVLVYRLSWETGKAALYRTISLPDVTGGLRDVLIDPRGTVYVLRGQEEVLVLQPDTDQIWHFPIDPSIGARRLRLGAGLYVEGADGNSYGVAATDPSQGFKPVKLEDSLAGVPVGMQGGTYTASLKLDSGTVRVLISDPHGQGSTVVRDFRISSPDLPIESASILGLDWVENMWVLLHISKEGWNGTESLLAVAVSPEGKKVGELRLPIDADASEDVFLGSTSPFTIYEMRCSTEGLTISNYSELVAPVTTTSITAP